MSGSSNSQIGPTFRKGSSNTLRTTSTGKAWRIHSSSSLMLATMQPSMLTSRGSLMMRRLTSSSQLRPWGPAGAAPVAECTYAFGVTNVNMFVATASILEDVEVSAYFGAAAGIISKDYLTDAGSILAVEARHPSYLRSALKEALFAQPFDTGPH
ncbi:hypothetical protein VE04_07534 [Pseudogymnoascus sp. 24MN13]|nr:hypothetical protein VE04_07534 [Pseudogymnoascus sp. 24MN13]